MIKFAQWHGVFAAGAASAAVFGLTGNALAGGFAVREQSASLMGSAFAGAAAGGDLSSAFWNPAAFANAGSGINTQSSYTVLLPDSTLSNGTTSVAGGPGLPFAASSTEIDKVGYLSSSYASYRFDPQTVFGISVTAPFGLATEPSNPDWAGRFHGREAEMLTLNFSPTVAYEVLPGVKVAAGLQVEYMRLRLWFGGPLPNAPSSSIKVDDAFGIGATAGIILNPAAGTSIGLGFRSSIDHKLSGYINSGTGLSAPVTAKLQTPEIVTASISQALASNMRVLGTVEWTNWSRIDNIPILGAISPLTRRPIAIDAHWDDGWFFSGGLEYDYLPQLTLRAGGAYEISPIQDPTQRLPQLPDSDRIWVTGGATYHYSDSTTFDLSYAHIFFDDAHIHRGALAFPPLILDADVSQSADIVSVGLRTRW